MNSITTGLSLFYLLNGYYPEGLEELNNSGYIENVRPNWEERFEYVPSSHDYNINIRHGDWSQPLK
jgi:hypothetical protein